jgi:ribosomal protein S18 acetylase RimI-like enzyme
MSILENNLPANAIPTDVGNNQVQKPDLEIVTKPSVEQLLELKDIFYREKYLQTMIRDSQRASSYQVLLKDRFTGQIAGFIASYYDPEMFENYVFLSELQIAENYRKLGLASMLVGKVIENTKNNSQKSGYLGVKTETESDNFPAQNLYEKNGFRKVENPYFEGITYQLDF